MSDPGQQAALARDLALCLLDSGVGFAAPDETPSTLLVGELPRDLPYPLPVPDGARVLGTLVRRLPVVVLAATLTTEAVLAFFTERLAAAGWTDDARRRGGGSSGGFVHAPRATTRLTASFYAPDRQLALTVVAAPAPDGHGITILLAPFTRIPPVSPRERRSRDNIFSVLPGLLPPAGGAQFFEGGSGSPDHVATSAWVEGDFPLAALQAHYTHALRHAGWSVADGAESGPAAWSRWTFHDDDGSRWSALLLIAQYAEPARRFELMLRAHRMEGDA